MNFTESKIVQKLSFQIKNLLPEIGIDNIRAEIIEGLSADRKYISSKFFYDSVGSELFNRITKLPEYYPTRTEKSILREISPVLMNTNSTFEIIELGSGDCSKISILLDAAESNLENTVYIPVDVSKSAIEKSAKELAVRYPGLQIQGYVVDFMNQLPLIPHAGYQRLICFFGSTIGNFSFQESIEILKTLELGLNENDSLLVGFDLIKSSKLLRAAYNDSMGITHEFNKNILKVVNNIIESDFNAENFDSVSFYNEVEARNEMSLIVIEDLKVNSPYFKAPLLLKKGDSIHTEYSYKYSIEIIEKMIENTGLFIQNIFSDSNNWFALVQFGKVHE